jgi:hypothetical protein
MGNANLSSITVGGLALVAPATTANILGDFGTGNATWASIVAGKAVLSPEQSKTRTIAGSGIGNNPVTLAWVVAADETDPEPSTWGTTAPAADFADGQCLFVRATAKDATTVMYYKLNIEVKKNDATADTIEIGGADADIGNGGTAVNVGAADQGLVFLSYTDALTADVVVTAADTDALVTGYYLGGTGTTTIAAADWETTWTIKELAHGQHIFVRIVAENGVPRYYRIALIVDEDPKLSVISFIDRSPPTTPPTTLPTVTGDLKAYRTTEAAWTDATDTITVALSPALAAKAIEIGTTAYNSDAIRTYAIVDTVGDVPLAADFKNSEVPAGDLSDGKCVFIKSIAGSNTVYYKVGIEVKSDDATLATLTVAGVSATLGTGGTAVNVAAAARGAVTIDDTEAAAPITIVTGPTQANATVTGWVVDAATATNPIFVTTGITGGNTITIPAPDDITTGQHLFVRVRAENGSTLRYYRIVVTVTP